MNQYDLPLTENSVQTILPVMQKTGLVMGFYPIALTTFKPGDLPVHTTSDGAVLTLMTVTVDTNPNQREVTQYVAAIAETEYANSVVNSLDFRQRPRVMKFEPWASADFIPVDKIGVRARYIMATQTWATLRSNGHFVSALQNNLAPVVVAPELPEPPPGENSTLTWSASIAYDAVFGPCAFFDFNWVEVFRSRSAVEPHRIQVVENPASGEFRAAVLGLPVGTAHGVLYNTVRIMKLADDVEPADYIFKFEIFGANGLSTPVEFTLTVN